MYSLFLVTFKILTTWKIYRSLLIKAMVNADHLANLQSSHSLYEDFKRDVKTLKECAAQILVFSQWWDWIQVETDYTSKQCSVKYDVNSLWDSRTVRRWNGVKFSYSTFLQTVGSCFSPLTLTNNLQMEFLDGQWIQDYAEGFDDPVDDVPIISLRSSEEASARLGFSIPMVKANLAACSLPGLTWVAKAVYEQNQEVLNYLVECRHIFSWFVTLRMEPVVYPEEEG